MRRLLPVFVLGLVFAAVAFGQEVQPPVLSTAVPATVRHEIIQLAFGGYAAKTFRLDKYSGQIFQLGTCPKDDKIGSSRCWREMEVLELPKALNDGRPRYQMFLSGPQQLLFLFNVDTGMTWQLGAPGINDKWFPFLDDLDCRTSRVC